MPTLLFPTIPLSGQVSGNVDLSKYPKLIAIAVPGISSGDLLIQGAYDTTSANFQRLLQTMVIPGSGDLRFATLAGSRMIPFPQDFTLPPYLRLETLSPQANVCTFTLLVRR